MAPKNFANQIRKTNPEISEEKIQKMTALMAAEMRDLEPIIIELATKLQRKYFTPDEVKGLLAFYRTPLGKKLLEKQSPMAQEGMALSQEIMGTRMQGLSQKFAEIMLKKN